MKANTIDDLLSHLRIYFQKESFSRKEADETPPLRSELFTKEQMRQHADQLASHHRLDYNKAPEQLLKRLSENEEVLVKVSDLLQDAVKNKQRISPAGEWLLDNFYLIEEQIVTGKRYLPKGYSIGLPRLTDGASAGLPRVYDIALEIISHSDGHVDISSLSNFIAAYQKKNQLTIGELWAIPIMLRLALLENLRRVAARIAIDRIDENLANNWADKMLQVAEKDPKSLVLIIADMARSNPPMVSAFVAPLAQRLQWKGAEISLALSWLDQHLSEKGLTINSMMLFENQQQAANQVSMSNSINSLRFLAKMDWREFVETMSVVEETLGEDLHATYIKMDFYTRDSYRHVVEKIAKKSALSEKEIATIAINLAKESSLNDPKDLRRAHVGHYLIGKGRVETEKKAIIKPGHKQAFRKFINKRQSAFYIIGCLLLTFAIAFLLFIKADSDGLQQGLFPALIVLLLITSSQLAIAIINWVTTLLVHPKQLPRMDFSSGIPGDCQTMVVVPALLVNVHQVEKLVDDLEVRFLANRDPRLSFALVTDYKDSKEETAVDDEALTDLVQKRVTELNKKYGRLYNDLFFLFHRPRRWNSKERAWMGWERKRGKLVELNQLIRRNVKQGFSLIVGEERVYSNVKYIITLDADTQLPREAAWKLVGIMAHPLNHALYSEKKNRIIDGYGIIQPRIAISLHGAERSLYTRMHENDSGIDPYTRVTSNVYQDLFGEGSFIGKGIYDVDVFEKILNKRFPENKILSHDLLEGAYTRCAFASDVQLYEEYPSRYRVDMNRRHRWIRGDWQIANWFLPFVPNFERRLNKNPVSALSRWKIFDNLRRSLVPIALLILLVSGWTILGSPWFWTLCVTAIVILPSLVASGWDILRKPDDTLLKHHFKNSAEAIYRNILQAVFTLVCLPYEAFISLDAILRTGWRMLITGRKLLEWNPYGFDQNSEYKNLFAVYISMWIVPVVSLTIFTYLVLYTPVTLLISFLFLAVWILSPAIVWWLSRPLDAGKTKLNQRQIYFLRKISRKTWAFFENFLGPEDNWLPPDNFQLHPITVLAHRTSPTNIGLSLLANLAAYDFGYITVTQLIERTSDTILSMQKMERYAGHFYNWYDTVTLKPLLPKYISSVDSGNLAGHLLTLKQGLSTISTEQFSFKKIISGLLDTAMIINDLLKKGEMEPFLVLTSELEKEAEKEHSGPKEMYDYVIQLLKHFATLKDNIDYTNRNDLYWWFERMEKQIGAVEEELRFIAPWLNLDSIPAEPVELEQFKQVRDLTAIAYMPEMFFDEIKDSLGAGDEKDKWLEELKGHVIKTGRDAKRKIDTLKKLEGLCEDFANMEYNFLYDESQHLLAIGYNVEEHRRDASFYDLLASEARLASFVAIAQGKIPQENWFALGRRLTSAAGIPVLLSWSGSMFEYLMPDLVMPSYDNTLLDQTGKGVVKKQIDYGRQCNVPWGISESCYNVVDAGLNYQYRAFGVPGLGFKRGLMDDLVIAPYASALGLMIDPEASCNNLERMSEDGYEGKYGFFESIDFTATRLPRGQSQILIQTYMAHHLGMSLLSMAYLLLDQPMQKRFEAEPRFQATLLLLQEQIPKAGTFYSGSANVAEIASLSTVSKMRIIDTPDTAIPEVQLLSNGNYHVMVTNAGGGYSKWKDHAVTRWREDTTCDNWGVFCFIRDLKNNVTWSTAHQPTLKEAKKYEAVFSQGRAEFRRLDNDIETHTEIIVSPEDDIEIRRTQITNKSDSRREIEITSYAEVVLAHPSSDASHPAFSNLFVETEILQNQHAILCTRRPRSKDEQQPWMFHLMKVNNKKPNAVSYETDRNTFIGRGNSIQSPQVMNNAKILSNTAGYVLDPVVAIRYTFLLEADETIMLDMMLGITETRDACQGLIDKYQDRHLRDRAFELSWTHSQVVLRQINASEADAQLYGKLAGSVIYANRQLRAQSEILLKNHRGQSALWSYSISGDLPIVLLQITASENMNLVKQLIQARTYWQLKGLVVDLFIWNEDESGYRQVLQDQIQSLITAGSNFNSAESRGGIFVRPADQISAEDRILLQTVARVIISDKQGSLSNQLNKKVTVKNTVNYLNPLPSIPINEIALNNPDLAFFNGLGGFSNQGHEYIITTNESSTPAPWANVIANKNFGTVISETGSSYSWYENAHEFRLTPWNNDPVTDTGGEAFYIRDERTGYFWSPMPFPAQGKTPYITKHGFGYSAFEHSETGIVSDTIIFTDPVQAIKFIIVNVHNLSGKERKISLTGYAEWVLGDLRPKSVMHVVTEYDNDTGALIARNPYNFEFENRVAFLDTDELNKTYTADRTEFIGRNKALKNPEVMKRAWLSGKHGAGLDSCAAMQVSFSLNTDEKKQVVFRVGAAGNVEEAKKLIQQFKGADVAMNALERVHQLWQRTLTAIQIETPDKAFNLISNGWLLYQTISCRLWARSGFYQSGGAYGFRDQLQDVIAVLHTDAQLARSQIMLSASRQFKEGDVQHWWHPPLGRGVRTHCSDDYLWLPFVTAKYVLSTGDKSILSENISFIEGRLVNPNEESYYDLPNISQEKASLYEHCKRAINFGCRFGEHGLPLIGSGDWNDGMNMVGKDGKGESVWLAFFLYDVLKKFIKIARLQSDELFAAECDQRANELEKSINKNAWDGNWYLRAFFDDGSPLGSSKNEECKIDSIAQSWSVLSGAGERKRSQLAMESVYKFLVRKNDQVIQLLDPPFNHADIEPGYIKGYVPGVRENGGQYTHAAIWTVMAFAKMGDSKRAWELLQMLNPVNHGKDEHAIALYKTEPYVVAADVYGFAPHTGRGGWTWYTGSAGWFYQLITESFIGLNKEGSKLSFKPMVPEEWSSFMVHYRFNDTMYHINFVRDANGDQEIKIEADGNSIREKFLTLIDDKVEHQVTVHFTASQFLLTKKEGLNFQPAK